LDRGGGGGERREEVIVCGGRGLLGHGEGGIHGSKVTKGVGVGGGGGGRCGGLGVEGVEVAEVVSGWCWGWRRGGGPVGKWIGHWKLDGWQLKEGGGDGQMGREVG